VGAGPTFLAVGRGGTGGASLTERAPACNRPFGVAPSMPVSLERGLDPGRWSIRRRKRDHVHDCGGV